MAGHNKWSKIKRQKGVNDAKRGAIFTRIGNQIAIAARSGADPDMNPSLALAIEKGLTVKEAELQYVPNMEVEITDDETRAKVEKLMDALDDVDDVVNVHTNAKFQLLKAPIGAFNFV